MHRAADGSPVFRPGWQVLGVAWAAVLFAVIISAARRVGGDAGDFFAYYDAARAMVRGEDPYTSGTGAYIYPPLVAYLYAPLAAMTPARAETIALGVNVVLMLAAAFLLTREFARRFDVTLDARAGATVAVIALLLTADKLKGELQMWQVNVPLLFLFASALSLLDRWPALAGMTLGLAFNIKYWPIVVLPQLVLRRRWTAAGAFVVGIVAFALLPATLSGWDVNLRHQATAYRGLLRTATGSEAAGPAANVPDLVFKCSVSITSVMARLAGPGAPTSVPMSRVAMIAAALLATAAWMHYRARIPFLYRPDGMRPDDPTARAGTGLEWAGLLTAVLLFSPQTNPRHLCLLLFLNVASVTLLMHPRLGASRRPLLFGTLVLLLGLILPPGSTLPSGWLEEWRQQAQTGWAYYGGPSWCETVMLGALLWTGLRYVSSVRAAVRVAPRELRMAA